MVAQRIFFAPIKCILEAPRHRKYAGPITTLRQERLNHFLRQSPVSWIIVRSLYLFPSPGISWELEFSTASSVLVWREWSWYCESESPSLSHWPSVARVCHFLSIVWDRWVLTVATGEMGSLDPQYTSFLPKEKLHQWFYTDCMALCGNMNNGKRVSGMSLYFPNELLGFDVAGFTLTQLLVSHC